MNTAIRTASFFLLLVAALTAVNASADEADRPSQEDGVAREASSDATAAQPQLVRISATIDGSGKIRFRKGKAVYEHKHWSPPVHVYFDGTPWTDLGVTPPSWADYSSRLDLTKAWLVKRKGRDTIALESTPDGFDLYLNDSPNGAAYYELTIAIPRRK